MFANLDLGMTGDQRFRFTVEGYSIITGEGPEYIPGPHFNPFSGASVTYATFSANKPIVSTGDFFPMSPNQSTVLSLGVDVSELGNQTPRGWLIINPDDQFGGKSGQVVTINGTPT